MKDEHERLMNALYIFYTDEEARLWLTLPHPQLDGETPADVLAAGGWNRVWQIIDSLESGAYI
jgi:uncharacterized protein (DUF2384 family)